MSQITITVSSIVAISGSVSVIAGAYLKLRRISRDKQKAKELEKALILQEAKDNTHKHKAALEAKIELMESELLAKIEVLSQKITNVEESVNIELEHAKESYNNELKFLGEKISELKDEMRTQLNQVVTLIGKLIDKT